MNIVQKTYRKIKNSFRKMAKKGRGYKTKSGKCAKPGYYKHKYGTGSKKKPSSKKK